jgi:hypothetical protein
MRNAILVSLFVVAVGTLASAQARPNFSGDWVLRESPLPHQTNTFRVRHTTDLLVVEIPTIAGSQERWEIRLDGTESANLIPGSASTNRVVTTAKWEGDVLVVSSTAGSRPTSRQRWMIGDGELRLATQILTPTETGYVVNEYARTTYTRR